MILLYIKQNNYNRNTDEDSNNLSTTSINNRKTTTSQNNNIRTTEIPNSNDVINDDLAAPIWRKNFPSSSTPVKLGSAETEFNKRKK